MPTRLVKYQETQAPLVRFQTYGRRRIRKTVTLSDRDRSRIPLKITRIDMPSSSSLRLRKLEDNIILLIDKADSVNDESKKRKLMTQLKYVQERLKDTRRTAQLMAPSREEDVRRRVQEIASKPKTGFASPRSSRRERLVRPAMRLRKHHSSRRRFVPVDVRKHVSKPKTGFESTRSSGRKRLVRRIVPVMRLRTYFNRDRKVYSRVFMDFPVQDMEARSSRRECRRRTGETLTGDRDRDRARLRDLELVALEKDVSAMLNDL